jgi:hypothetical protein
LKADSKVVQRGGSIKTIRGKERESSSMKRNSLIQVNEDALLLESVLKADGKVIER